MGQIEQQSLGATPEGQQLLGGALDAVRRAVCLNLTSQLADPLLTRFEELAAGCDKSKIWDITISTLRSALLRKIAATRFGLKFDPQAELAGNQLLRGALMSIHTYTFRDDLPYKGDRSILKEMIALFPDVQCPK